MELNGAVHLIGQTETIGNNGFTKRQLVIATSEQYVQYVPIDFVKDKTTILDNYKVGDNVSVSVNVRGSEYNGKYYVNLQGWKISKSDNPNDTVVQAEVIDLPNLSQDDTGLPF